MTVFTIFFRIHTLFLERKGVKVKLSSLHTQNRVAMHGNSSLGSVERIAMVLHSSAQLETPTRETSQHALSLTKEEKSALTIQTHN